jgi:Kef-type K+ transport system membrane component KefB
LVVLTVAANFGGWIISLTTLPRLIGMLIVGIVFQVSECFTTSVAYYEKRFSSSHALVLLYTEF